MLQAIGKLLVGRAVIAFGSAGLAAAAPARAAQNHPFSSLSSGAQQTAAPGSPARKEQIRR